MEELVLKRSKYYGCGCVDVAVGVDVGMGVGVAVAVGVDVAVAVKVSAECLSWLPSASLFETESLTDP